MICKFFFCFQNVKDDDDKILELIQRASTDPRRDSTRKMIISQLDRGAEMKYLEMDDFTPKGSLGSGTSSDVCLLIRKKDKQKFAGKMFKGAIGIREFTKEASIMNKCSKACPTIINLVGIITSPKCLVLEYCVNGSLDDALQRDSENVNRGSKTEFPFLLRLRYILDMCKAVNVLHHENVCHRDIAMRNLLLSNDKKHVLLADFSLSRVMNLAFETQSTLTDIVPSESAPETIRNHIGSTGRETMERYYSLKSDIWSMGITMFEIIDKELGAVLPSSFPSVEISDKELRAVLPSAFPSDCFPSEDVFNRMQELWILINRCWYGKPEKRPQSWEMQEKIENLISYPVYTGNQHEEYITCYSGRGILNGVSTYEDFLMPTPSCSQSPMPVLSPFMNTVLENELWLSCRSSKCESPISSSFAMQECSDSLIDLSQYDTSEIQTSYVQLPRFGVSAQMEKRNTKKDEQVLIGYLSTFKAKLRGNSLSPNIIPKNRYNKKFVVSRNKSDPLTPNSHLRVNGGLKYFGRLGSMSSVFSYTVSSLEDLSSVREMNDYCSPLSVSFRSSATNIAYCGDRHFFKNPNLLSPERTDTSDYLLTPDLEPVRENSECEVINNDTPRFYIEVM